MSKKIVLAIILTLITLSFPRDIQAKTKTQAISLTTVTSSSPAPTSSISGTASDSGIVATPSAIIEQKIQANSDKDITQVTGKTKDKLVEILDQNPIRPLTWYNFLQHAIRRAITNGLPANIVVLVLLFPLIAAIISFSRHVIGLRGFGVYTPAVLAVAFVSTGIINGILLFLIILAAAMIMKRTLKQLHLQYLPRTAMLLWGVSVVVLAVLILASLFNVSTLLSISIFPLLIIMLLTENFMESQLSSSLSEAVQLTGETLLIAIICSLLIGLEPIQKIVILQPELTLISVAVFNWIVGHYAGLRLLEWVRFWSIIDQ